MRNKYKYYAAITSQIPFCATPLRLDSYNHCQFNCSYCFARTREGHGRDERLQTANPEALRRRLDRVNKGKINSLLDEFISRRIPFQLGGMSDPFSAIEQKEKITLKYIRILNEFDYPFIVSTKSSLPGTIEYMEAFRGANAYVRFSTTVVDRALRPVIDKGCPPISEVASAAEKLSSISIPVSFRMQPIVPGHESNFSDLLRLASSSGVKHVSAEYLKVPLEANVNFSPALSGLMNGEPIATYIKYGSKKQGSEYCLPLFYRAEYLVSMYHEAKRCGMTFGFADNDLLVHSDGGACCGASDLYLRGANYFSANIVAVVKSKMIGEEIRFDDYFMEWLPVHSISTSLNSKSRLSKPELGLNEWVGYLKKMWIGEYGVFSPEYFDGVEKTNKVDSEGLPIFVRCESEFENLLRVSSLPGATRPISELA